MKFFICIFILVFSRCDKNDGLYSIVIKNNSDYTISCYFALGGKFGTIYPDTLLPETKNYIIPDIEPNTKYIYYVGINWDEIFHSLPKDTLSVYIFHSDTLLKYSWEEVRIDYKIAKRSDLSLGDLKNMNWLINYP